MSEPENSQTQSSSSNEETTTTKEPALSEPSSNLVSIKKSDQVESTTALTTGSVEEKSEEDKDKSTALLPETKEQTFATKLNVDCPTKATADPLLQDNTNILNLNEEAAPVGDDIAKAPESDGNNMLDEKVDKSKDPVTEDTSITETKDVSSSSHDEAKSEESNTKSATAIDNLVLQKDSVEERKFETIDKEESIATSNSDKTDISTTQLSNPLSTTQNFISQTDKKEEIEEMDVDDLPEAQVDVKSVNESPLGILPDKMKEDEEMKEEIKAEPEIVAAEELDNQTKEIKTSESSKENESSPEKKPRLEQEIENNVPPLSENVDEKPDVKLERDADFSSTNAASFDNPDSKSISSQYLSEKSPTSSTQTSSFFPTNSSKSAINQKQNPSELFQAKLQAYYDSKESSSTYEPTNTKHVSEVKEVRHKAIMTKPFMMTKGVSCRPHPCHKQTQTDFPKHPALVPLAVPCYMPIPLSMYQKPYPVPIPVPLPIPVPIFVPTTRNSYRGIAKQIRKIRRKIPSDPFEAEMLALAGGMDQNGDDSDDSLPDTSPLSPTDGDENEDRSNRNHRSQLDLLEPMLDLEGEIKGDRIIPKPLPPVTADPLPVPTPLSQRQGQQGPKNTQITTNNFKRRHSATDDSEDTNDENHKATGEWDGRRRSAAAAAASRRRAKQKREAQGVPHAIGGADTNHSLTSTANKPPQDRPDAKHHLKFTYGVNAWKHWVVGKNAELEKARAQGKYMKPFETDLLKLRADELNYTLCMFVKEVKKPNGDNYAADSVLYLTYGIQEYLFENGRIDNIFTDQYYEPFTSALHEVVKDFKLPMNELGYYVTRIEEEHLWEAKQLGAHSPQVLLNTLVYFDTKYFMLRTVEDHQKLSFTHIMKHWKKAPGQKEGQKSVILRYYPPAKKGQRNDERKCYEQQESGETPLRCPVKLYEFYLSKCPESSKTRNDVFYLMPERSCVPDSPVWYSNTALPMHSIDKMLQRNLMVKEVQEHMLADAS